MFGDQFYPEREDGVGAMVGFIQRIVQLSSESPDRSETEKNSEVMDHIMTNCFHLGEAAEMIEEAVKAENELIPWKTFTRCAKEISDSYFCVRYEIIWDYINDFKRVLPRLETLWHQLQEQRLQGMKTE